MSTAMGNHSESLPAGTGSNSPAGLKARTIKLPIPPSVNAAYVNRKTGKGVGRYKTKRYKSWERQADWWCASAGLFTNGQRPFTTGPANVTVRLPMTMRGDVDNRLKAAVDFLVSRGFTADDSTHLSVTACKDPGLGRVAWCEIDISESNPHD